jgi:hypothetical protein
MASIDEHILQLEKEIADKQKEVDGLKALKGRYPDLQRQEARWKKISYASKSVNDKVDDFEQRFNCGCCSDSPLEVFPFLNTSDGKIYSSPSCFTIGERCDYPHYRGITPYPNWQDKLRKENIPEALIERMENLFTPEDDDEDDTSLEEGNNS